jgi:ribonuclease D
MNVIDNTADLADFCSELRKSDFITVDTEFIRETTYWPQLCLIQAASPERAAMIDPLAEGIDLEPFFDVLRDPDTVKVMHGCRQDIEIFFNLAQIIPTPLFDTQIAAMACGFGDAVGYETLIGRTVGAKIDKGSRFTDWGRRPLTEAQLKYALADVTHLRDAYLVLRDQLAANGREHWVHEEMAVLLDPETYLQRPENAWKRLKMQERRPHVIGVLVAVAAWREQHARERDVPRNRILKDDAIREIALQSPKDTQALSRLRAVPKGFDKSRLAESLIEAVTTGLDADPKTLPKMPRAVVNRAGIGPLVDLLRVLLKQRCDECDVAPKLIASAADLDRIASDNAPDVPAMHGWRYEIFGQYAADLKNGKLALASEDDKVVLVPRP